MHGVHGAADVGDYRCPSRNPRATTPRGTEDTAPCQALGTHAWDSVTLLGPCVFPFYRGDTEVLEGDIKVFGLDE